MPLRIAMLVPGLSAHDAVSNDALGMARVLRAVGHEVAFFAPSARGVEEPVRPPRELEGWLASPRDVVVYHYCVGWDFALALLARVHARRVIRYHNITPPAFFEGWSPGYVAACAEGRAQLDGYAAMRCELYLGDSPYNIEDFTTRGVAPERCAVLPPLHAVEALAALAPDARRLPTGAPLLLMIGRIAPNKGFLDLIDALAACRAGIAPDAHLLLLGKLDPNLSAYGDALQGRIEERGVRAHLTWIDDAGGAELRAACERADALVMLSRHEGFCVPLVEAMALGTPIVALGSSAVPWTLGDAGLVWESADPWLIASSVARIGRDEALRRELRARGRARYEHVFSPPVLAAGLRDIMARFAA